MNILTYMLEGDNDNYKLKMNFLLKLTEYVINWDLNVFFLKR